MLLKQFADICRMIKIEHSVFALPYAWAGAFLAARSLPPWSVLGFLTLAMVAVRSFAMTVNRVADLKYDRVNPRTARRPLVTGAIGVNFAKFFAVFMAVLFIAACAFLNTVCLALSVPALVFAGAYSYVKRFSALCHFWLGATLGLAPLAGSLAVNPSGPDPGSVTLFFAVTFWVGAFDIYYAFQDIQVDRVNQLRSLPANYGEKAALFIAGFSHTLTVIFLFLTGLVANLGWPWYPICAAIAILLLYEHRLVNPEDLRHVNTAFFTMNGVIAFIVLVGVILGIYF